MNATDEHSESEFYNLDKFEFHKNSERTGLKYAVNYLFERILNVNYLQQVCFLRANLLWCATAQFIFPPGNNSTNHLINFSER